MTQVDYASPLPRHRRVWTVWLVLLVAFVVWVGVQAVAIVGAAASRFGLENLTIENIGKAIAPPEVLLSITLLANAALGAAALFAAWLSPVPLVDRLRLGRSNATWPALLAMSIGVLALAYVLGIASQLIPVPRSRTLPEIQKVISQTIGGAAFLAFFVIGLAPAIFEELLFRGYVQTRLRRRWGIVAGIVIASVLFGAMHMDPLQSPLTAIIGLYLGYITERTGSIRPAMLCHAVNNSVQVGLVLALRHAPEEVLKQAQQGPPATQMLIIPLIVSLGIFALCLWWISAAMRHRPWPTPVQDLQPPALPGEQPPLSWSQFPYSPPPPTEGRQPPQ